MAIQSAIISLSAATFVFGYRMNYHLVQDISAVFGGVNVSFFLALGMLGLGLQNHTANAGVIYGLYSLAGFSGVIACDTIGAYLFKISPDLPGLALVLPANMVQFTMLLISIFCCK